MKTRFICAYIAFLPVGLTTLASSREPVPGPGDASQLYYLPQYKGSVSSFGKVTYKNVYPRSSLVYLPLLHMFAVSWFPIRELVSVFQSFQLNGIL